MCEDYFNLSAAGLIGVGEWMCSFLLLIHENQSIISNWNLPFYFPPQRRGKKGEHLVFDRSQFGDFLGRTIFSVRHVSWAVLSVSARDPTEIVLIPGASTGSGSLCSELPAMAGRSARFCVDIRFFPIFLHSVSRISQTKNSVNKCQTHFLQLHEEAAQSSYLSLSLTLTQSDAHYLYRKLIGRG